MPEKVKKNRVALAGMKRKLASLKKYLPVFEKQRAALNKMLQDEEIVFNRLTEERKRLQEEISPWVALFNDSAVDISVLISVKSVEMEEDNVFGTAIPVFKNVVFEEFHIDYHFYPLWVPEGIDAVKRMVETEARLYASTRRTDAIRKGYEEANQKVNLFDKKLIPETQGIIKEIKTALDAQQIASIVIAKSAKKLQEKRSTAA